MQPPSQFDLKTTLLARVPIAVWIAANASLAVFAAWGGNRSSWPSIVQLTSVGSSVAQSVVVGVLVFRLGNRLLAFAAGITFVVSSGILFEYFDDYYDMLLLTVFRFRHLAILYVMGMIAGCLKVDALKNCSPVWMLSTRYSLRSLMIFVIGLSTLLGLKTFCPGGYELYVRYGMTPLLPFYWPVTISLGLAAVIGVIAATPKRSNVERAMLLLLAGSLGVLPPYYYYSVITTIRVTGMWSLQMMVTAVMAAVIYASYLRATRTA
jgi:hypothetical protein